MKIKKKTTAHLHFYPSQSPRRKKRNKRNGRDGSKKLSQLGMMPTRVAIIIEGETSIRPMNFLHPMKYRRLKKKKKL